MVVVRRGDRVLMDREALAQWTGRPVRTIRQHCTVTDRGDHGRALYDAEAGAALLRTIPARRRAQT